MGRHEAEWQAPDMGGRPVACRGVAGVLFFAFPGVPARRVQPASRTPARPPTRAYGAGSGGTLWPRSRGRVRIVEREDVGMAQAGRDLDLSQETLGADRGRQLRVEHLDGHLATVLPIGGEVDGRHATASQHALEAVSGGGQDFGPPAPRRSRLRGQDGRERDEYGCDLGIGPVSVGARVYRWQSGVWSKSISACGGGRADPGDSPAGPRGPGAGCQRVGAARGSITSFRRQPSATSRTIMTMKPPSALTVARSVDPSCCEPGISSSMTT